MDLEPVIGLEIHIQLKTKSKMFCSCANAFGEAEPNTAVCPICMAYPGTLPIPNKQAIEWIQMLGAALNCELAKKSKFDRKSYFYPDLPKGYQISQYDEPFCGKGEITLMNEGNKQKIGITRIHLEEDAAKNIHPKGADYTLIDYNRAGTPLVEIVTEPDITSPAMAKVFLQELQRIARALGIANADMEKGQMRCDANISLREKGTDKLFAKTEIKNVNSFKFVEKALEYEVERQTKLWEKGEAPDTQSTRGYDSDSGKTVEQRVKEEAADYRYFPEPDIPPFAFNEEQLDGYKKFLPELPYEKRERLVRQYGVSDEQAFLLADNDFLVEFFENTASEILQLDNEQVDIAKSDREPLVKDALNIILRDLRKMIEVSNVPEDSVNITPANFAEMVVLIYQGKMNKNAIVEVMSEMQRTGGDPDHILQNLGLEQVSDTSELEKYVDQVIAENPDVVEKIRGGKKEATQFLMGQVMRLSKGKADAKEVIELLGKKIG